jgi:hypothetical protein
MAIRATNGEVAVDAPRKPRKPRPAGTTLTIRFEEAGDLEEVHARARAAGYRSTEEYARRLLLGFEQPATHHEEPSMFVVQQFRGTSAHNEELVDRAVSRHQTLVGAVKAAARRNREARLKGHSGTSYAPAREDGNAIPAEELAEARRQADRP